MTNDHQTTPTEPTGKGLRPGALGMASSVILATASAAPAYSLAATLTFIVAYVGFQAPVIVLLAFVPILFVSFGYAALNRADPDCGTIFTWASRVLGPRVGFMGGWAIIASFVLVMGSLAQVAGQYVFLLFGADDIGSDASSPWVLLVGLGWIALMGLVCYRGIEVAAAVQRVLLYVEFAMLAIFAGVALVKAYSGNGAPGSETPHWSWFNPFAIDSANSFVSALVLMLFIYWGWETAVTVTEETADARRIPGRAATMSTILLLALYLGATVATLAFAGIGSTGVGLTNPENSGDVFSALGHAVFGGSGIGSVAYHLLVLMVLTSAAASTETTILTLGRTMLSMSSFGAIPKAFSRIHPRYRVPTVGTILTALAGATFYVIMNFLADGQVIGDAVSSCGLMIAFYYGLTGLTSAWAHRGVAGGARVRWMRCILPAIGGLVLVAAGLWSLRNNWSPESSYTTWTLPFGPHWEIGGVFIIGVLTMLLGLVLMAIWSRRAPEFFDEGLPPLDADDLGREPVGQERA
ncbi:MAG TPA: APC family permease [Nocardioides sp.]|uniref:APC family permease n=1 Tax=Nocardioides sp. TaxID=35761 RepID=UPI002ED7D8C5